MDAIESNKSESGDIPQKIFLEFIAELRKSGLAVPIIDQLEQQIVTDGNLTEQAIRTALQAQPQK